MTVDDNSNQVSTGDMRERDDVVVEKKNNKNMDSDTLSNLLEC